MPDTTARTDAASHTPGDLPLGEPLPGWTPRPVPPRSALEGRFCRVEPLDPEGHVGDLFTAYTADPDGRSWTYLPYGPFADLAELKAWMQATCLGDDPLFHAVIDKASGKALGVASYLRIVPAIGSI
ncbi:MAG TPA: GNAT family N-acetyltransferase, partial [Kiloniellaceae bacterium]|nr:GNAT family N-acetyltransferase [Kiloniellaceae bacterium]